jgi:hypothetical protein
VKLRAASELHEDNKKIEEEEEEEERKKVRKYLGSERKRVMDLRHNRQLENNCS